MGAAFDPKRVTRGGKKYFEDIRIIRGCRDKKRHPTFEVANNAKEAMERITGEKFNTYFCQCCHFYHIGRDHRAMGEVGYIHEERKNK
jgi:hypothetical protein